MDGPTAGHSWPQSCLVFSPSSSSSLELGQSKTCSSYLLLSTARSRSVPLEARDSHRVKSTAVVRYDPATATIAIVTTSATTSTTTTTLVVSTTTTNAVTTTQATTTAIISALRNRCGWGNEKEKENTTITTTHFTTTDTVTSTTATTSANTTTTNTTAKKKVAFVARLSLSGNVDRPSLKCDESIVHCTRSDQVDGFVMSDPLNAVNNVLEKNSGCHVPPTSTAPGGIIITGNSRSETINAHTQTNTVDDIDTVDTFVHIQGMTPSTTVAELDRDNMGIADLKNAIGYKNAGKSCHGNESSHRDHFNIEEGNVEIENEHKMSGQRWSLDPDSPSKASRVTVVEVSPFLPHVSHDLDVSISGQYARDKNDDRDKDEVDDHLDEEIFKRDESLNLSQAEKSMDPLNFSASNCPSTEAAQRCISSNCPSTEALERRASSPSTSPWRKTEKKRLIGKFKSDEYDSRRNEGNDKDDHAEFERGNDRDRVNYGTLRNEVESIQGQGMKGPKRSEWMNGHGEVKGTRDWKRVEWMNGDTLRRGRMQKTAAKVEETHFPE